MNNNTNFYKIEDSQYGKVVSKLTDKKIFQQYIDNNGGKAPDIPEEVVNIYDNIFENVSGINSIYLPSSLKKIPKKLFQNNKDTLINFGNYYDIIVREITPDKKYETTYKLKNIHNKNLFNNYCDTHEGNNPYIPEGITSISDFVFKDNRSLRILTLPESTICMCKQGCKNCINLQKVNLSSKFMDFGEEISIMTNYTPDGEGGMYVSVRENVYDENGDFVLLFSSPDPPEDFAYLRCQRVRIEYEVYEGYRVPIEAVRHYDGMTGVYTLHGGYVYFRRINVLYEGEGYYIVSKYADIEEGKPKTYRILGFNEDGIVGDYDSLHATAKKLSLEKSVYNNGGMPLKYGYSTPYFYHLADLEEIIIVGSDLYHGKVLN